MKTIWLVGASEGIGRALALELANKGFGLILSARNKDRLEELKAEIGKSAIAIPLDVRDSASVKSAWTEIEAKKKNINTIIYCAGYYKPMSALDFDLLEAEKMIDINLTGALRILDHIIPHFISKNQGHIVLIGSIAGYRGLPNAMGYGPSKAGLIHLAENLECDLSKHGIKIQVINPGFVKTRLTDLNDFSMPSIISAEQAAIQIVGKMQSNKFESRFPFLFAGFLKILSKLPYFLYFKIVRKFVV